MQNPCNINGEDIVFAFKTFLRKTIGNQKLFTCLLVLSIPVFLTKNLIYMLFTK